MISNYILSRRNSARKRNAKTMGYFKIKSNFKLSTIFVKYSHVWGLKILDYDCSSYYPFIKTFIKISVGGGSVVKSTGFLQRTWVQFPKPTWPSISPAPRDLISSSDLHKALKHKWYTDTYASKRIIYT